MIEHFNWFKFILDANIITKIRIFFLQKSTKNGRIAEISFSEKKKIAIKKTFFSRFDMFLFNVINNFLWIKLGTKIYE